MVCPPYTKASAVLILVLAVVLQLLEDRATAFNTALLLLGVSSLIHHSRLHTWFIHDAVQKADVALCMVTGMLCCCRYRDDPAWIVAATYVVGSILGIWCGLIPSTTPKDVQRASVLHCSAHFAFVVAITCLEVSRRRSRPYGTRP